MDVLIEAVWSVQLRMCQQRLVVVHSSGHTDKGWLECAARRSNRDA